jgi:hypothetical protein
LAFEQTLQRVVELGCQKGERSPWGKTVRTCQQLANHKQALWTFLDTQESSPPTMPLSTKSSPQEYVLSGQR